MTDFAKRTTSGVIEQPHLILLHAPDGIGKTTFAANAPNPIIVGPEVGSRQLNVGRFEPRDWEDSLNYLDWLVDQPYKSVGIDSLDWFEKMNHKHVRGESVSMEMAYGGFSKAYGVAETEWFKFIDRIKKLRDSGKHVILLAHSHITEFNDPATETPYHRYELKLYKNKAGTVDHRALFRELCDVVAFANKETFSKGEGKGTRGISTDRRIMYLERSATYDAKNRFNLPPQMPFTLSAWHDLDTAIKKSKPESVEDIVRKTNKLLELVTDADTKKKASAEIKKAKDDRGRLLKLRSRLETITKEKVS